MKDSAKAKVSSIAITVEGNGGENGGKNGGKNGGEYGGENGGENGAGKNEAAEDKSAKKSGEIAKKKVGLENMVNLQLVILNLKSLKVNFLTLNYNFYNFLGLFVNSWNRCRHEGASIPCKLVNCSKSQLLWSFSSLYSERKILYTFIFYIHLYLIYIYVFIFYTGRFWYFS